MFKRILISSFLILIFSPVFALAYKNPGQPSGFVNDFANVLSIQDKQALEMKISQFEKETSNEISVVIINDLGGDTIENYAVELFKDWGIGKKGNDNGVLILVSIGDRKMRIEVGYGLEGALTDAQSNWIINSVMKPSFQSGNYYQGIDGAVDNIIAATKGEYIPSQSTSNKKSASSGDFFFLLIYLIFVPFMWLLRIMARSKSWWLGGILGAIAGVVVGFFEGFVYLGIAAMGVFGILGLLLDLFVSKNYQKVQQSGGRFPWWLGGGSGGFSGGSGGGGFGGFGGGGSGGGGSSGDW